MHKINRILTICLIAVCTAITLVATTLVAVGAYLYYTADFLQPDITIEASDGCLSINGDSLKVCNRGYLRLNRHGIWEMYLSGNPIQRGTAYGSMCRELLKYQEDAFVGQIHNIAGSERWIDFLHKLVIIFNHSMSENIPREYLEEICAMSRYCTHKYDKYGTPYVRQLNYHAAHDIGHAMQRYMLVGCSSFAVWGEKSASKDLMVGRNFDFYVGDNFAKNKVVLFVEPSSGYKFASVSWPGMIGVLSGMNEMGITVTINAAEGEIPTSSAMPISLLARHILQYASNIDEAYSLAQKYRTFVSESILIGSVNDGHAAIIEKTPNKIALYESPNTHIVCTNHYQSDLFLHDKYNCSNIANSDSPYRFHRMNELLTGHYPISTSDAVAILRNRFGISNTDIGLCNEKSINQFIAHHSVVFLPSERKMWVSTAPWQLGEFVCYDLKKIFDNNVSPLSSDELNIEADSSAICNDCVCVYHYRQQYKTITTAIAHKQKLDKEIIDDFIACNPNYYRVYDTIGNYYLDVCNNRSQAEKYWHKALSLEIPHIDERNMIMDKIKNND